MLNDLLVPMQAAVEFTMRNDDGALPANLNEADLVLVAPRFGDVSTTSKINCFIK